MMNLYGDDRNIYGNGKNQRYKYTLKEKIFDFFDIYFIDPRKRVKNVKKAEKMINEVDCKDSEKLKEISDFLIGNELVSANFGKAISKESLENYITKVILNGNKILSEDIMDYYIRRAPKENAEIYEARHNNKLSVKLKGKISKIKENIKQAYDFSTIHKCKVAKNLTKEIKKVDPKDTEKLNKIYNSIKKYDFCWSHYGKFLSNESLSTFIKKADENGNKIIDKGIRYTIEKEIAFNNEQNNTKSNNEREL